MILNWICLREASRASLRILVRETASRRMFNSKNEDSIARQDSNWGVTPSLDSKSCPCATHPFGADGPQRYAVRPRKSALLDDQLLLTVCLVTSTP
jgi:hypothetical protein